MRSCQAADVRIIPLSRRKQWFESPWARQIDRDSSVRPVAGGLPLGVGELADLGELIDVPRRDRQRQKMAQRVDCPIELRAEFALGCVIARVRAPLWRRAQGAAIDNGCGRSAPHPDVKRNTARKSRVSVSNTPAASQHCAY